ncbi:MAG: heavy metal-associated domain-containing protein [Candidatus Eisenbacteria bacterium]
MEERTLHLPAMSCPRCVASIERELKAVRGVTFVEAHLATKTATVRWEEPATWDRIRTLLTQIGYPPRE